MIDYILIILFVALSAFFSGTEIVYTSVNRIRLRNLAENGSKIASLAIRISDRFDIALTALLLGNNFVNVAASSVSTTVALAIAAKIDSESGQSIAVTASTAIITILILIFGEIVPKVVFKKNSEKMALVTAYPLAAMIVLFSPIIAVVSLLLKGLEKLWGKADENVTEEELATIIEAAEEGGGIDEDKSDLLQNALEFSDISLSEIITHRKDVIALDIDDSFEKNLSVINASRYSRLPVYKNSIDEIVGILNINRYYKALAKEPRTKVEDIMREPLFMLDTVKLPAALNTMREKQEQVVVVLDEYGGTLGIVTMEDILEQIVGEIWDESDEIIEKLVENQDGTYKVLGEMNVYDMFYELDIDDRDFETECNTVGGWCAEVLEQTPEVGMTFDYKNMTVTVTKTDDLLVEEVLITVKELPEEDEDE